MALTSPGVEVTIIDESQYIPAATNSVPYILLATAQNKASGAGVGVAAGTLAINANKTYLITSQRDLIATFGVPFFSKTTAGTPINGYELNEYGLLAAWSALGVSNRCYIQRADIDLSELTATLARPLGEPEDGTYWLDTSSTQWGVFEWNLTTAAFTNKIPTVLTDTTNLYTGTTQPIDGYGAIGDYAVVTPMINDQMHNPIYYKRGGPTASQTNSTYLSGLYNTWVKIGSDDWKTAWPTITGTQAPATLTAGNSIFINDEEVIVPVSPNTVTGLANAINDADILGVYAATIGGKLYLYGTSEATNDGSTASNSGIIAINNGTGTPLTALGITAGQYIVTTFLHSPNYQEPRWNSSGSTPAPTGSIWVKTNNVNQGTNLIMKKYNAALGTWVQQACPLFLGTSPQSLYVLDPTGGGQNIPAGTTCAVTDPGYQTPDVAELEIQERYATGPTIVTGTTVPYDGDFAPGEAFQITFSIPGSPNNVGGGETPIIATLTGSNPEDFCQAVSAAIGETGYNYVSASINSSGNIVFTHSAGGNITLRPVSGGGTPLDAAGFSLNTPFCRLASEVNGYNGILLSYFVTPGSAGNLFNYTPSDTAPDQDPDNGRLWYYSATNQVDIMIQSDGVWKGYQNVTNDMRGYNLSLTNATGPIFSTTPPTTQTNDQPLVYGDLWIDTSDLENYPVLSRWQEVNGNDEWVLIDNTDQTTQNGILFADARWAPNGDTDPISDPFPPISGTGGLIESNYLDLDAPDASLYPQGTLLWNTRRSGFNVKSFQVNYFNASNFPDQTLPTEKNAWVTQNPTKNNGSPYMGRQAQRVQIVQALKAGIDTSTAAREEQRVFNLISCPQYPELVPNLIALNNERNNTAFVIGDTPLRLAPQDILTWASNNDGEGLPTADGLISRDVYSGVFYPSCQTTDLSGSPVVQPPSHMMIRTIIRSDEVAYPWLAPAGTRRGVIDNATQIGYISTETGEFESLGVRQGLRDVLYENSINPITFVPGVGITNFGNKTTTGLTSALDRINVARLVAFIRGRLTEIAKQFLFEPNDQITRNEITNAITSLMIDLVAKRGIYDYLVVCDLTNNTPARIDRNELYVDIAIEPVKAVEFIYIPVRIKNTGEIANQSV